MSGCPHHPLSLPADPLDFCECAAFALSERVALMSEGCKEPASRVEDRALEAVRREWSDPRPAWGGAG